MVDRVAKDLRRGLLAIRGDARLDAHEHRRDHGLEPGEVILLSSSPGHLMSRLYGRYGSKRMSTVRATRCDYYYQHDFDSWRDQLGSLGMGGPNAVFINLAAVSLLFNHV